MKQDSIVEALREDLLDRSRRGQVKYGTTLDRKDLDAVEWSQHLYEELIDAALYVRRLMREMETLPQPAKDATACEIASDIMGLAEMRELDLRWEQRLELHGLIESVVRQRSVKQ